MTDAFAPFPEQARERLREARALIHDVAATTPGAGAVVEEVKWGVPSFTTSPRTGSPLRLGVAKCGAPALFVHCQTRLMADFAMTAPPDLVIEGTRAVHLPDDVRVLRPLITAALTYRLKR